MDEKTIDFVKEIIDKIVAVVKEIARLIATAVRPFVNSFINALYYYADSKTVHLAKHGKNRSIRKKNHKKAIQQGLALMLKEVNE